MAENDAPQMKATLGLTGLTMNAMALIAPGAFLWLTFLAQATEGTTAPSMWIGILFAVLLPTIQTGPAQLENVHAYKIGDEQHHLHYGYRIDWYLGTAGEYYGVEGMNWLNPPLFENPSATEAIDGRTYIFVNDGADVQYLGWRQDGVLYWVSNTLNDTLTATQMLDIARSTQPVQS